MYFLNKHKTLVLNRTTLLEDFKTSKAQDTWCPGPLYLVYRHASKHDHLNNLNNYCDCVRCVFSTVPPYSRPVVPSFSTWWFQIFFYFHPYLGKRSHLTSIFFRWVETTNQIWAPFKTTSLHFTQHQKRRQLLPSGCGYTSPGYGGHRKCIRELHLGRRWTERSVTVGVKGFVKKNNNKSNKEEISHKCQLNDLYNLCVFFMLYIYTNMFMYIYIFINRQ